MTELHSSCWLHSSQKPKVLYVCMMPNMEWTLLCSAKLNICYADLKTGRPAAHGLKRNVLWMIHEYNLPTMMLIKWMTRTAIVAEY